MPDLSLEAALADSVLFRASLQKSEDQFDELGTILDGVLRASRNTLELVAKLNEALLNLAPMVRKLSNMEIFANKMVSHCIGSTVEVIESTRALYEKMLRNFGQQLLVPLVQSVQDDLKDIKEMRRSQEKSRDRYEALLNKFCALPKLREYPLIREDAFQLYESRKIYYRQLFNYLIKMERFQAGSEIFFIEKSLVCVQELESFAGTLDHIISGMGEPASKVRDQLCDLRKQAKAAAIRMEKAQKQKMAAVESRYNPDAPLERSKGFEKSGYLFKRRVRAMGGVSWRRVYVVVGQGKLAQYVNNPRVRGQVDELSAVNVLLCEVRSADTADRRNCFEVKTSQETFTLQAETEEELRDWVRVIENAKAYAIRKQNSPLVNVQVEAEDDHGPQTIVDEFRKIFPEFSSETLLIIFSCLLMENKRLGRLFATEAHLLFYSNTFSSIYQTRDSLAEIEEITICPESATIRITRPGVVREIFCFSCESLHYEQLALLRKNAHLEKPKSASELYELLYSNSGQEGRPDGTGLSASAEPVKINEVKCECDGHPENTGINAVIPLSVDDLYELLFKPNSPVLTETHRRRSYHGLTVGPWAGEQEVSRTTHFVVPINHPLVKATEATCSEVQTIKRKDPGACYVIMVESTTPGIPYGNSFVTLSQYCLTHHSPGSSRLQVSYGIRWLKNPLVKSVIRNMAMKSLSEYTKDLEAALWIEVQRIKPDAVPSSTQMAAQENELSKGMPSTSKPFSGLIEMAQDLLQPRWKLAVVALGFLVLAWSIFRACHGPTPLDLRVPTQIRWHDERHQRAFERMGKHRVALSQEACRLQVGQYATWLADQLISCYESRPAPQCSQLEKAFQQIQSLDSCPGK